MVRQVRARGRVEVERGLVAQLAPDLRAALLQAAHPVDQAEGEVLLQAQQRAVVRLGAPSSRAARLIRLLCFKDNSCCICSISIETSVTILV